MKIPSFNWKRLCYDIVHTKHLKANMSLFSGAKTNYLLIWLIQKYRFLSLHEDIDFVELFVLTGISQQVPGIRSCNHMQVLDERQLVRNTSHIISLLGLIFGILSSVRTIFKDLVRYPLGREGVFTPGRCVCLIYNAMCRVFNIMQYKSCYKFYP